MASTIWKGHLTFGLVSIPIRVHAAARSERIHLNQLHRECHSRVRQPLYCPTCERMLDRGEIIKGYEYEKDQYVLVEEEEVKKIAPSSSTAMEILEFVRLSEVDPIYYDSSYLLVPEEAGRKAYFLLVETMEESGYAGIAKLVMHQREHTVILRPRQNGITLHTVYYENEIRQVEEYGQTDSIEVKAQEKKLAKQLIENLVGDFQPARYHDEYQKQLQGLVEAKREGREIAAAPEQKLAPVIDLMDALKKSLAQSEAVPRKPPVRAVETGRKRARRKAPAP